MGKSKLVACRFDDELYNLVNDNVLQNSELIRRAVIQYLEGAIPTDSVGFDEEDMYNMVYNNLYNVEVLPLKTELSYLHQRAQELERDKQFFQNQVSALMLVKHPSLREWVRSLIRGRTE